jgi:uncharacterized protein (TIGR00296 family)
MDPPVNTPSKLRENCGVFVTLNNVKVSSHELRGCIGYPSPVEPLVEATIDSAIQAATNDPRFPPVSLQELNNEIAIEVSVLTPPELIKVEDPSEYPSRIQIGRDGLVIERGWQKGLLLPQVAPEWNWDEEEFLSNCCMKAGLSLDSWLIRGTKVYKFQAVIFEEKTPDGEVASKSLSEKEDR